jgi:hypothetical protein
LVEFLEFLVMLVVPKFRRSIVRWLWRTPISNSLYLPAGAVLDLGRSTQELILENALLRQQLIVLRRQINRPQLKNTDRTLLLWLASRLHRWKSNLLIVQPDTVLRWHKEGFRLFWKRKSKGQILQCGNAFRNSGIDQADGSRESSMGCGAHKRGVAETRHSGMQAYDTEIHAASTQAKALGPQAWPELENVLIQSC